MGSIVLTHYDFDIRYKPGNINYVTDALSRLPVRSDLSEEISFDTIIHKIRINSINHNLIRASNIIDEIKNCPVLSKVLELSTTTWPSSNVDSELQPYFTIRNSISSDNGLLFFENRVIIPRKLQNEILHILHKAHQGVIRMKQFARLYCWWPKVNDDIEKYCKACNVCSKFAISIDAKSKYRNMQ